MFSPFCLKGDAKFCTSQQINWQTAKSEIKQLVTNGMNRLHIVLLRVFFCICDLETVLNPSC